MPTRKKSSSSRKVAAKKTTSTKKTRKSSSSKTSKRTLISPRGSRRYVRRNKKGQFKEEVSVGRSLAADRRKKSKTRVAKGQGDRGDTGSEGIIQKIFG